MTQKGVNILYILSIIGVVTLGVLLLYDDVYYWVSGEYFDGRKEIEIADETPDIPTISTDELKAKIDSGDSFFLMDVRTPEEFQEGHIEQSVNMPLAEIENRIGKLALVKEKEIITVCDNQGCNRADQAATKLIGLGFENVKSYREGVNAWRQAGYALSTQTLDPENFIGIFKDFETQTISVEDAANKIFNEDTIVMDVQKKENHIAEHIDGSIYLEITDSAARSRDEGIAKDAQIIFYSEVGIRSKIPTESFKRAGFQNVWSLDGGLAAWIEAGQEVTSN